MDMTYWCESCARKNNCYTIKSRPKCFVAITNTDNRAEQTEPQLTQKCPFDDSLPCEWVCTEYGKCKYKPQTERSE